MLKSESVWTYTEKSLFPEIDTMHKYGSAFTAKRTEVITNPFWKDVFKHFKEFQGGKKSIENFVELQRETLHYNPCFLIDKKNEETIVQ